MAINIPSGKKVIILRRNSNDEDDKVVDVPMILSEPITISLSSSFEPFLQMTGNKWINEIGKLARDVNLPGFGGKLEEKFGGGFSGVLMEAGFQTWTGTDPLSLNITVTFHVDKKNVDGEKQVWIPSLKLAKLPLPSKGETEDIEINKTNYSVTNLVPPGPSILSVLKKDQDTSGQLYSIKIGKVLNIFPAIIKKAEPTFSIETDSNGYPMWAQVNLDIQSVSIATQEMIDREGVASRL